MSAAHNTEPLANGKLAEALRRRNPAWTHQTLHAEQTGLIHQGTAKRPDILIAAPLSQPVIVETEFAPARGVEQDAIARLGVELEATEEPVEGVLSVILPEHLKTGDLETIDQAGFRYATHSLAPNGEKVRWPADGWLEGGIDELADAIEHLTLSGRRLAEGTELLERVVQSAAEQLSMHAGEDSLSKIAADLHQAQGRQTERMAAAICVSAWVFHAAIEKQKGIPPVPRAGSIDKNRLLSTWDAILAINYWPIFSIARDIVLELPVMAVPPVMERIAKSVSDLARVGATSYHDLTGRMFQTLITDRKFLATFYTLPESACLLAELAVERLDVDWADRAAIERLRIADFACGTGALLSAAQRAVYRRYRRVGGNDKDLHRAMMEQVLTGLDIMPAATHLTCSMLSSAHPSVGYGESQIHTMPYGIEDNETHIGALDLLDADHSYSLFATGETMGGTESGQRSEHSVAVDDESCDLVIMNPPFTRPRGHESADEGVPISSFAGFGTPVDEQRAMAVKLKRCHPDFGHGFAGLASNFMDLGHRKLKDGGVLALVLPFTFCQGMAWKKARRSLRARYSDIHVVSLAVAGQVARAFSADTGMAECIVVATKRDEGTPGAMFSNLEARPPSLLGAAIAVTAARKQIVKGDILDGGAAGVRSIDVIKAVQHLLGGQLLMPRWTQAVALPMVPLGAVANRGLNSSDISRKLPSSAPFDIRPIRKGEVPAYPALWSHAAERERQLVVQSDTCAEARCGREKKAATVWSRTASHLHVNQDFQLNSQALAMCLTLGKCLGGRAWPNIIPRDSRHEIPLCTLV